MRLSKRSLVCLFGILFISLLLQPSLAFAEERIITFLSDIVVNPDSTMDVTETITVWCEGNEIQRGILRDFPTIYKDRYGNRVKVGFDVVEVLRNNSKEPYKIEGMPNGKRVRIGDKDVFLPTNTEQVYTIKYHTNRQLVFREDHDELYWNATGNDWKFTIEKATARVKLPGVNHSGITREAYTGKQGDKGANYTSFVDEETSEVYFSIKSPLSAQEGLTIVVSFPKGFVAEPSKMDKIRFILHDNLVYLYGIIGLFFLVGYYTLIWAKVGRDIPAGTIIPLFEPPLNFSPGAVRYIRKMEMDNDVLTAAVIDMAVKGYLKISEDEGVWILQKASEMLSPDECGLSDDEIALAKALFISGESSFELKKENYTTTLAAKQAQHKVLADKFLNSYFITNSRYMWFGLIVTGLTALAFVSALNIHGGGVAIVLFIVIMIVLHIVTHSLFYYLLKAPTHLGRTVIDQIEGLKMYMSVAEKERLNILNPPDENLQLYEKLLPYALALGVENKWSNKLAHVLEKASDDGEYQPAWYSSTSGAFLTGAALTSSITSSVSSAISSSSSPPGSSSGSGGGGSSGGGGGGGGGGGW